MPPGGFSSSPRYCRPGSTIRIPVHMIETINNSTVSSSYHAETGQEPTPEELSKRMEISEENS